MKCSSCKNSLSTDQCPNSALPSLQFCGKHVKIKEPRIWVTVNNVIPKVVIIQKTWRGFLIRKQILEAGVGVLKRSLCQNDDELISLEPKERHNPLDYFSFEENGKIWWFSIETLARIVFETMKPVNPYTRQPISIDTRRRLRDICRLTNVQIRCPTATSIWIQVCQILEENGFESTNPILFQSLSRSQYTALLVLLRNDLQAIHAEDQKNLFYGRVVSTIQNLLKRYTPFSGQTDASLKVAVLFYNCLRRIPNPYSLCFAIMSAYTRL